MGAGSLREGPSPSSSSYVVIVLRGCGLIHHGMVVCGVWSYLMGCPSLSSISEAR